MFCPSCGQQQTSEETKFCSRCGFLLTGVWDLLSNKGITNQSLTVRENEAISPRKRGLRQGGKLMLLGLIIVPIMTIIFASLNFHPALVIITAVLTFWGGILRMIYARIFESAFPGEANAENKTLNFVKKAIGRKTDALPPQSISVSSYAPPVTEKWRTTNDLVHPSVIDNTTKLLEKDK